MIFLDKLESLILPYSTLISLTGNVVSIVALIISLLAFNHSKLKSKLNLLYYTTRDYENGFYEEFYKNGYGKIKLSVDESTIDRTNGIAFVCLTIPCTSINLLLENTGKVSAKHPAIIMKFNGIVLNKPFNDEWELSNHRYAIGGYEGIRWIGNGDVIVYPKIPITFKGLSFSSAEVSINEKPSIDITVVADGCKAKSFNIPIEILNI